MLEAFAVRRLWPRPPTSPQLAMTFMLSGIAGIWLSSALYLHQEMGIVYKKAEDMSRARVKARSEGDIGGLPAGEKTLGDPKHTLCTARFLLQTKHLAYLVSLQLNGNGNSSNYNNAGGSRLTLSAVE